MGVVSSEISISEKVGNNPFSAFLYFQRFTASPARVALGLAAFAGAFAQVALGLAAFAGAFAQVAQVSRHLPGRLRRLRRSHGICRGVCAGCAGLTAFTGAAGEKCAEARDCLRRALVSVGTEERFLERLKKTSMNEFSPDKSANILSLMENFTEID